MEESSPQPTKKREREGLEICDSHASSKKLFTEAHLLFRQMRISDTPAPPTILGELPSHSLFPLSESCETFIERHFKSLSPNSNSTNSNLLKIQVLCADLGVPLNFSFFALAYKFNAVERCFFSRQEFIKGLMPLIDSPWKLQQALGEMEAYGALHFEAIYLFAFKLLKETEFQKLLPIPYAIEAMHVLMWNYPHTAAFTKFLQQQTQYTGINYDQWLMFFLFSKSIAPDFAEYNVDDAWPVLIDDFVMQMTSRAPHEQDDGEMVMNYPTASQQFQYSPPSRYLVPPSSPSSPRSPACVERVATSGDEFEPCMTVRCEDELLLVENHVDDYSCDVIESERGVNEHEPRPPLMQLLDPPILARFEKTATSFDCASPTKLRAHDNALRRSHHVESGSLWDALAGGTHAGHSRTSRAVPRRSFTLDQLDTEDDATGMPSRVPLASPTRVAFSSPRKSRQPSVQCCSIHLFRHLTHLESVATRDSEDRPSTHSVPACTGNDPLDIVAGDDLGMELC